MEIVTVKSSRDYNSLAVAKTYLEANGIMCTLKDEYMSQLYSHTDLVGGTKLQVREEDARQAIELLIEGGFASREDYEVPESTMKIVRLVEKFRSFFKKKK